KPRCAKCSGQLMAREGWGSGAFGCGARYWLGTTRGRYLPRVALSSTSATVRRGRSLELQVILEVALLQAVAQGGHEAACVGAVDDLVVVGQRQEDHVADRDGLVLVLGQDDRALHDRTGADHGCLRRNQDRGVGQGTLGTDVGDGEGAAGHLVRL